MRLGVPGLKLQFHRGDDWWAALHPKAVLVSDFLNDRYMRQGIDVPLSSNATCVRGSGHVDYALDVDGRFTPFADNILRRSTNGLLAETLGTRLTNYPDTPLTNGALIVANATAEPGNFLNVFSNAARVSSNGATWHRLTIGGAGFAATIGLPYGFSALYKAGSSGRVRVVLRDEPGAVDSSCAGIVGAVGIDGNWAGTISHMRETLLGDGVYLLSGIITPNASSNYSISLSPDSNITGEDVVVIGGWIEAAGPSTPILDNPAGIGARAADIIADPLPAHWVSDALTIVLKIDKIEIAAGGEGYLLSVSDGTTANILDLRIDGSGTLVARANSANLGLQELFGTQVANDGLPHTIALSWDNGTGDVSLSLDGVSEVALGRNVPAAATIDQVKIMSAYDTSLQPKGLCTLFGAVPGYRTGAALEALGG